MVTVKRKAVVFDVGRVLVHWNPAVVLASVQAISRVDAPALKALMQAVNHRLGTGEVDGPAFHRHLIEQAGTSTDWAEFYAAYCRGLCRNEEMLAFAREVQRRGHKVGVISNTNAVHVQWLRQEVPEFGAFDAVLFSSEVGLLKPDPAIYHLVLDRLQTSAHQAIFVDDIAANVAAAEALGMAGVVHVEPAESKARINAWLQMA